MRSKAGKKQSQGTSFNSRTREGCDRILFKAVATTIVSIHAPARGAIFPIIFREESWCFNSRTREGCDLYVHGLTIIWTVSIHAPARGAILTRRTSRSQFSVSIHAPARGAIQTNTKKGRYIMFQFTHPRGVRLPQQKQRLAGYSFNSRTREGCDKKQGPTILYNDVSIHAPARGAIVNSTLQTKSMCFNSRTREGCDF